MYFIASVLGAIVIAALQVLFAKESLWRWILRVASILLCLCAGWLLVDFLAEEGWGMWAGLNLPIWARGLIGAAIGAVAFVALTSLHSSAQSGEASKPAEAQTSSISASEAARRERILAEITDEYAPGSGMVVGEPPADFVNSRLAARGETWRVQEKPKSQYVVIEENSGSSINVLNSEDTVVERNRVLGQPATIGVQDSKATAVRNNEVNSTSSSPKDGK